MKTLVCIIAALSIVFVAHGVEPGDVIINEVRFYPKGQHELAVEAVELLVVKDNCDLNGLQLTDRNEYFRATEDQCTLNDLGRGFLKSVPSGTIIVISDGNGNDDTNASDFVMRFHAKSSLYCNIAPTGHAFQLNNQGDNLHILHESRQIDFVQYALNGRLGVSNGQPAGMKWEKEGAGAIEVSDEPLSVGFRFIGDSVELSDFIASWRPFTVEEDNNVGKPNGGRNSEWIKKLRSDHKPLPDVNEEVGNDSKP